MHSSDPKESWPALASDNDPSTWAAAWFGTLPAQPNQAPVAIIPEQP